MNNDGYFEKHYGQLVGYKVTQIALDDSDTNEEWLGLVLTRGGFKKVAWILRDPEGNGAGFLDIVDV